MEKTKQVVKPKAKPKSNIYLKNEHLLREILLSKEKGELTRTALKMLMLLTEKISSGFPYEDGEDKKDCMALAHYDLVKYWRSFNAEKSTNAFAYFTSIIRRGIFKGWNQIHPKKYHGTLRLDLNYNENSEGIYSLSG